MSDNNPLRRSYAVDPKGYDQPQENGPLGQHSGSAFDSPRSFSSQEQRSFSELQNHSSTDTQMSDYSHLDYPLPTDYRIRAQQGSSPQGYSQPDSSPQNSSAYSFPQQSNAQQGFHSQAHPLSPQSYSMQGYSPQGQSSQGSSPQAYLQGRTTSFRPQDHQPHMNSRYGRQDYAQPRGQIYGHTALCDIPPLLPVGAWSDHRPTYDHTIFPTHEQSPPQSSQSIQYDYQPFRPTPPDSVDSRKEDARAKALSIGQLLNNEVDQSLHSQQFFFGQAWHGLAPQDIQAQSLSASQFTGIDEPAASDPVEIQAQELDADQATDTAATADPMEIQVHGLDDSQVIGALATDGTIEMQIQAIRACQPITFQATGHPNPKLPIPMGSEPTSRETLIELMMGSEPVLSTPPKPTKPLASQFTYITTGNTVKARRLYSTAPGLTGVIVHSAQPAPAQPAASRPESPPPPRKVLPKPPKPKSWNRPKANLQPATSRLGSRAEVAEDQPEEARRNNPVPMIIIDAPSPPKNDAPTQNPTSSTASNVEQVSAPTPPQTTEPKCTTCNFSFTIWINERLRRGMVIDGGRNIEAADGTTVPFELTDQATRQKHRSSHPAPNIPRPVGSRNFRFIVDQLHAHPTERRVWSVLYAGETDWELGLCFTTFMTPHYCPHQGLGAQYCTWRHVGLTEEERAHIAYHAGWLGFLEHVDKYWGVPRAPERLGLLQRRERRVRHLEMAIAHGEEFGRGMEGVEAFARELGGFVKEAEVEYR